MDIRPPSSFHSALYRNYHGYHYATWKDDILCIIKFCFNDNPVIKIVVTMIKYKGKITGIRVQIHYESKTCREK
jgi:hypothetical protein